jgi:hypothetical protein
VNELDENLNEKKRKLKYEIKLDNEHKQLQDIENIDPSNIDHEMIE